MAFPCSHSHSLKLTSFLIAGLPFSLARQSFSYIRKPLSRLPSILLSVSWAFQKEGEMSSFIFIGLVNPARRERETQALPHWYHGDPFPSAPDQIYTTHPSSYSSFKQGPEEREDGRDGRIRGSGRHPPPYIPSWLSANCSLG